MAMAAVSWGDDGAVSQADLSRVRTALHCTVLRCAALLAAARVPVPARCLLGVVAVWLLPAVWECAAEP